MVFAHLRLKLHSYKPLSCTCLLMFMRKMTPSGNDMTMTMTIGHRAKSSSKLFYLIHSGVLLIVRRVPVKESKEHFDFMLLKSIFGNKYQVFI